MDQIDKYLKESADVALEQIKLKSVFFDIAEQVLHRVQNGGTVFFCGNGGSAADSQHLAAELIGRFKKNRKPISSIALTTDTSIITSTANDFSYEEIFSRQLLGLASEKDVLIAISTSGESQSVLNAVNVANDIGMLTVGFSGKNYNKLCEIVNYKLQIPSKETGIIQQGHITFGQLLCLFLEEKLFN
jgi:D-sedoheptulose 7-phosphate isomerase